MAVLAKVGFVAHLTGLAVQRRQCRMKLQPVSLMRPWLLLGVALRAEAWLVAGLAGRVLVSYLEAVCAKPSRVLVRCRLPLLMTGHTEFLHVAEVTLTYVLLGRRGMLLMPVLRVYLVLRVAIRTEVLLVALVAAPRLAAELRRMFLYPPQLVRSLDTVTISAEPLRMTKPTILLPYLDLGWMYLHPVFGVWGRHTVTVIAEVRLVASLTCLLIACYLLLMPFNPLLAESARLADPQGFMADATVIGHFLAIMALEASFHSRSVDSSCVRAVDYSIVAFRAADPHVPVLLMRDLEPVVDGCISGARVALLAVFIRHAALDSANIHVALDVFVHLTHGHKLAAGHVDHSGHNVALFAFNFLVRGNAPCIIVYVHLVA